MSTGTGNSRPARMYAVAATLLSLARAFVRGHRSEAAGCICPCCDNYCKVKKYSVSARQARELYALYRAGLGVPVHWQDWLTSSARMQCCLRYNGLIEQLTGDPTKPFDRSGEWAITQAGIDWIDGVADRNTIPQYVYVVNKTVIDRSDATMTYAQALRNTWTPEDAARSDVTDL